MIIIIFILNFGISLLNAVLTGYSWIETKAIGGIPRFMAWMGATMSSVGFSWCYLMIIAKLAGPDCFNKLPEIYVNKMLSLGYLILVIPLIGSGIAVTINSWVYFWKKKTLAGGAIAGYNTAVNIINIYQAYQAIPSAWEDAVSLFSKDDSDDSNDNFSRIAIILAIAAVCLGAITTVAIIRTVADIKSKNKIVEYYQQKFNR